MPQGSILGPLLFLVIVNDLPAGVCYSTLLLFADDAKCTKSITGPNDPSLLQNYLNTLSSWSNKWNLFFNNSKCFLVRFCSSLTSSQSLPDTYTIDNYLIKRCTCSHHKDLGVVLCSDLSWSLHIQGITAKAYQTLGLLCRTFSQAIPRQSKKSLYISLIRSKLIYCSQLWKPHLLKDILALENVHRHSTKFILNDFTSSYKSRLTTLRLLPLMPL